MQRIVFFGKGGIGKSTTSTNVSAAFSIRGERVLHVGCDPKHDSTVSLLGGRLLQPVVDKIHRLEGLTPADVVTRSPLGIDCVEAGGPEAGVGCGGRGITRMMEIFHAAKLLQDDRYTAAVYDVLGDVVCGGFAAPLRKGIGEKVIIVASEEVMALYAANNIARAVCHYAVNGIVLGGMIINLRDNTEDRAPMERFAKLINTKIIGYVPRDPLIREAEYRRQTVMEHAPRAPISNVFRDLAEKIWNLDPAGCPLPTPLSDQQFYACTQTKFEMSAAAAQALAGAAVGAASEPAGAEVVVPSTLARRSVDNRKVEYEEELFAGIRAVRLGRVNAADAVQRLRQHFPKEATALAESDLVS